MYHYDPTEVRQKQPKSYNGRTTNNNDGGTDINADDTMLCKRVVTKDRRYITQITCYEKGSEGSGDKEKKALRLPVYAKQTSGGTLAALFNFARQGRSTVTTYRDRSYTNIERVTSHTRLETRLPSQRPIYIRQ
jgi:hypothetical protein